MILEECDVMFCLLKRGDRYGGFSFWEGGNERKEIWIEKYKEL